MTHEEVKKLIVRANKQGARGIQVIDFVEPQTASQSGYYLLSKFIEPTTASEAAWYDK